MARLEITATLTGDYHYTAPAYGYGYETRYIYTFLGEDGKAYVWKTTTFMVLEYEDAKGWITKANGKTYNTAKINKGDVIRIKATVKGESEYNGQPQTEINRVTVLERTFRAKTPEEMFDAVEIPNNLKLVDDAIREYYGLGCENAGD